MCWNNRHYDVGCDRTWPTTISVAGCKSCRFTTWRQCGRGQHKIMRPQPNTICSRLRTYQSSRSAQIARPVSECILIGNGLVCMAVGFERYPTLFQVGMSRCTWNETKRDAICSSELRGGWRPNEACILSQLCVLPPYPRRSKVGEEQIILTLTLTIIIY